MPRNTASEKFNKVHAIIGQRLADLRRTRGMSQSALAEKIGITFQQLQKYEKGSNKIEIARLMELSEILNVPFSIFIDGAAEGFSFHGYGSTPEGELAVDDVLDSREGQRSILSAVRHLQGMSPTVRQHCVGVIRAIAEAENSVT